MTNEKTIGYGLIGAGAFGTFCAKAYQSLDTVRPIAVCDQNATAAESTAAQIDAQVFDLDALLGSDEIDIVHIATPPSTHRPLAERCLNAGKHVLCEKPIALNEDDAKAMIDLAHKRKRVLAINLIMRYDPLCLAVKRIVEENLLGEPLHGYFENYAKDENLPPDHWFWDKTRSGGIFIEHGVHFFDLFEWWLGEGAIVAAQESKRRQTDIVDQVQATVRHGHVLTNHYHGFTQASRMDRQRFCLLCDRGTIVLEEWVPTKIQVDGLMDHRQRQRIEALLPAARTTTVETYEEEHRRGSQRHQPFEVDGRFVIDADVGMSKAELYPYVVRELMKDQAAAIIDPSHERRVTERNGLASLLYALDAERLATAERPL